jgi:hypothetical protein
MKRKREDEDRELRRVFSELRMLKAPNRAVHALLSHLDVERDEARPRPFSAAPLRRIRREILIAVFATLIVAVPLTFWVTKRYAVEKPLRRTYVVRFIYEDEDAKSVSLIGDFNNWRKNEIVLERAGESRLWTTELLLDEGFYKYGFLVNETNIVSDPLSRYKVKDSFGHESSLMVLADGNEYGGSS